MSNSENCCFSSIFYLQILLLGFGEKGLCVFLVKISIKTLNQKVDYQERVVCDDFLEQLDHSTNDSSKLKELVPIKPWLRVVDGL